MSYQVDWKPMKDAPIGREILVIHIPSGHVYLHEIFGRKDFESLDQNENKYQWTELPDPPRTKMICRHCAEEIVHSGEDYIHKTTNSAYCQHFAEPEEES